MEIIFDRWDAGFHGRNPGSVPVRSYKQAVQFLTVLANATGPSQVIQARVDVAGGAWTAYFHIEDERLYEANKDYEARYCLNDPGASNYKGPRKRADQEDSRK